MTVPKYKYENIMKKIKILLFAFLAMFTTTTVLGCSDDDDNNSFETLPASVQKAFSNKYPDSRFEEWEKKGGYYVIEFNNNNTEAEAWFNDDEWQMTETDIRYNDLPAAVKTAFKSSAYADWRVDDVDMVERLKMPTLYILDVEKGKMEYELYYLEDGSLLKEIADSDNDDVYLPQVPAEITKAINTMYPGAVILDVEMEKGMYEAEIMYENIEREVVFDHNFKWMYTKWDVRPSELSDAVLNYIQSTYPGYVVDDVEVYSTEADGIYFQIELEKGNSEIEIRIKANGELVK